MPTFLLLLVLVIGAIGLFLAMPGGRGDLDRRGRVRLHERPLTAPPAGNPIVVLTEQA